MWVICYAFGVFMGIKLGYALKEKEIFEDELRASKRSASTTRDSSE